jgi:hypothetical protein
MRKLGLLFLYCMFISVCNTQAAGDAPVESPVVTPVKSPVMLQGEVIQGGLLLGKAPAGSKVSLNNTLLQVSAAGDFVFGLDRDAESGDVLEVVMPDGEIWRQVLEVKTREYAIQRVDGVPVDIQSSQKSEETWLRIRDEALLVSEVRKKVLPLLAFKQTFAWPLIGRISGVFGSQRVYNGEPGTPHYGVDIAAPVGTIVRAPADGVVTLAQDDLYYSGGTLIIDHGLGVSSSFIHLSKILVKVGDTIHQGDEIAKVGATGRASGPHLDWRMNWLERRIDPQLLVPAMSAK